MKTTTKINKKKVTGDKRILTVLIMVIIVLLSYSAESQTGQLVFKIEDKNQITEIEKKLENNKIRIKSADAGLTETFEKYRLYKFKQLYPSSKRAELLKYYVLEADSYVELVDELKQKHQDKFTYIQEYAEPIPLYKPNDYNFRLQYSSDALRNVGLSYLNLINAPEAWNITKGDPNVIVGIHDNHLYADHQEFKGKIFKVYDTNIRSNFANKQDHGTMVAGLIAANTDNYTGIASIAYNCRIAKTTDNKNDLLIMAQEGIKVINISQDWGSYNPADQELMNELTEDYNITVVAAAGNDDASTYVYPASYDNVISVTSVGHEFDRGTTINGRQFDWKDCHKIYISPELTKTTHQHNDKVDICAPGYNILTLCHPETYLNGFSKPTGRLYSIENGSSFAAAIVSGVCALMYSVNPALTPLEVEDIIKSTAADIYSIPENTEYKGLLGAGRIDAYKAVKKAADLSKSLITLSSATTNFQNEIKVYPNPTHGKINVSGLQTGNQIRIFNISGTLIHDYTCVENNKVIPMDDYPVGMYIMEATDKDKMLGRCKIIRR